MIVVKGLSDAKLLGSNNVSFANNSALSISCNIIKILRRYPIPMFSFK